MCLLVAALAAKAGPGNPTGPHGGRRLEAAPGRHREGARITGHALDGDTGAGLAGVAVKLFGEGFSRDTTTTSGGVFQFADVPVGVYTLDAVKTGCVDGRYGRRWPDGPSARLPIIDTSALDGIDIRLWHFAAISGSVFDASDEPLVGVDVSILKRTATEGTPHISSVAEAVTDDRGAYRAGMLVPGSYLALIRSARATFISEVAPSLEQRATAGRRLWIGANLVQQSNELPLGQGGDGHLSVLPPTFFPGTDDPTQAIVIQLRSGDDRTGVDFHPRLAAAFTVSGTVGDDNGNPAPFVPLYVVPTGPAVSGSDSGFEVGRTTTDGAGHFRVFGVPAGSYVIRAFRLPPRRPYPPQFPIPTEEVIFNTMYGSWMPQDPPGRVGPPPSEPGIWASQELAVLDRDVTVALTVHTAARVYGRIALDGAAPVPPGQLNALKVTLISAGGSTIGQLIPEAVNGSTGEFAVWGAPPGDYVIRVIGRIPGWYVKSITCGGRDCLDLPFSIGDQDIHDVRIVLGNGPGTEVAGVVRTNGKPNRDAVVLIFPSDSGHWQTADISGRFKDCVTTPAGDYSVTDLPAGDYLVVAVDPTTAQDWRQHDVLERLTPRATHIRLAEGQRSVQDLEAIALIAAVGALPDPSSGRSGATSVRASDGGLRRVDQLNR